MKTPIVNISSFQERELLRAEMAWRQQMKLWRAEASKIADATHDAYSRAAYGPHWERCAILLLGLKYTPTQVRHILCSKLMRFVADFSDKPYGSLSALDLAVYIDRFGVPQEMTR